MVITLLDTLIDRYRQTSQKAVCIWRELEREFVGLLRLDILDYTTLIHSYLVAIFIAVGTLKVPSESCATLRHYKVTLLTLGVGEFSVVVGLDLHAIALEELTLLALCDGLVEEYLYLNILSCSHDIYGRSIAPLDIEVGLADKVLLRLIKCCRNSLSALYDSGVVALQ